MIKLVPGVAAGALALALLAGCTARRPDETVTVTVTPTQPTPTQSTSAPAAAARTPTSAPAAPSSPRPSASTLTRLAGTCDTVLTTASVSDAIGGRSIAGQEAFVVGPPQKDIGRLAYLNCRYGVTGSGAAATPKIEIGVSLYSTPRAAAARIAATSDDYTAHGATGTDVTVDGAPATLLAGASGADYSAPLLVLSSGQRTVAVSVYPAIARGAAASRDAEALARLALANTA